MFKKDEEVSIKNAETIIGPSIKVKGNFFGEGDIIVEGSLEGAIKTSNNLFIGEKAKINANIEAKQAKISGEVHGNLIIHGYLELSSTAKVYGDIQASTLSVENGAIFNGACNMTKDKKTEVKEAKQI
ncbi:MAG: polymer-forming cytoskeletal protein [Patescibacteria group bacterium]|jgi:cytoskeletal protein CcmA (bactofilin family)|nr:polymer-forming cytoskeletal protein [Patescibacteria group bacterium]